MVYKTLSSFSYGIILVFVCLYKHIFIMHPFNNVTILKFAVKRKLMMCVSSVDIGRTRINGIYSFQ